MSYLLCSFFSFVLVAIVEVALAHRRKNKWDSVLGLMMGLLNCSTELGLDWSRIKMLRPCEPHGTKATLGDETSFSPEAARKARKEEFCLVFTIMPRRLDISKPFLLKTAGSLLNFRDGILIEKSRRNNSPTPPPPPTNAITIFWFKVFKVFNPSKV